MASKSNLNPDAKPWDPKQMRSSEAERTIFVTFSIGYPLREEEIYWFFTREYGECIEKIDLYRGDGRYIHPLFGRIVFTKCCVPFMVLGGHEQVLFKVHGKNLCCKRFKRSA